MSNYSFGKIIKDLRHKKGITQSRLAELLSVSPQAVSKWENNVGYPDFTLLAPLSDILDVSTDFLLGKNIDTKAEEIRAAKEKVLEIWRDENDTSDDSVLIWREMCRKYPSDYKCRNELAFQLSCTDRDDPDAEKRYREAAELFESVIDESTDTETRDFALSRLVHLYGNLLDEAELAIEFAKKGSQAYASVPSLMSSIPGNPEKKHWQQYEVWEMTCSLAWAIADQNYDNVQDEIFAIRTALKIIDTVCYDKARAYFDSYFSAYFKRRLCILRANNGMLDDTVYDDIEAMILSAKRTDEEKLGKYFFEGNMFMDSVWYEHTLPDCQMKWAKEALDDNGFDSIREDLRFRELCEMIKD